MRNEKCKMGHRPWRLGLWLILLCCFCGRLDAQEDAEAIWQRAERRATRNQQALQHVDQVLQAWLKLINPETGLPPQRYDRNEVWTVANAAADLYSSLVLDATFVDQKALHGVLQRALQTEREHGQRIGRLPDDLNVHTLQFVHPEPDLSRCLFGASEWCRDGLLRITEATGTDTPWYERMVELVNEIMTRGNVESPYGPLPGDIEVCGEMLQTLSRLHAITGDDKYRAWAERIADYYLFEVPPHKQPTLRLRDHGGEILSGLAEAYAMLYRADRTKADSYEAPLREMLSRVLEVGQMPNGMFANIINPRDGKIISVGLRNRTRGTNTNWGYTCNAHATFDLVRGENSYERFIVKALADLPVDYYRDEHFAGSVWHGSSDYFADFLENAMVHDNRCRVPGVQQWVDQTIPRMWAFQREDGTVNRHYHDGSFGRTSILFARMCSEGTYVVPWQQGLGVGAVANCAALYVTVHTPASWSGRLCFDFPRWRDVLHLPVNYPRINELTEWYVVEKKAVYQVSIDGDPPREVTGQDLADGLPLKSQASGRIHIVVRRVP